MHDNLRALLDFRKQLILSRVRIIDSLIWILARAFAAVRIRIWQRTGVRLKGLGFLLRRLTSNRTFNALGHRWHFDYRIAAAYSSLLEGGFLEPETHTFLQHIASNAPRPFTFIDVGANIGEMVVHIAGQANIAGIIAFEPHPVCAIVCEENLRLNGAKGEVRRYVVGDGSARAFVIDEKEPARSAINLNGAERATTIRLDDELAAIQQSVLLIDVEGAELEVLRGAKAFIQRSEPLVIFEYHDGTRQHYSLDSVRAVLGTKYRLARLRSDGRLDGQVEEDTWNCVAFAVQSQWADVCSKVMVAPYRS